VLWGVSETSVCEIVWDRSRGEDRLKTQRLKTRAPTHVIPMPENSGLSRNNQFGKTAVKSKTAVGELFATENTSSLSHTDSYLMTSHQQVPIRIRSLPTDQPESDSLTRTSSRYLVSPAMMLFLVKGVSPPPSIPPNPSARRSTLSLPPPSSRDCRVKARRSSPSRSGYDRPYSSPRWG